LFDKHNGINDWKDFYNGVDNIKDSQIDNINNISGQNTPQPKNVRSKQSQSFNETDDNSNTVFPNSTLKTGPLRFKKLKNSLESILDKDPILGLDLSNLNSI